MENRCRNPKDPFSNDYCYNLQKTYGLGWKIAGIFAQKTRLLISTYQENTQLMFIKWANLLCCTKLLPNFVSPENSACDSGGFQSPWGTPCPSSMWFSDVPWINRPFWSTPIDGKFPSQVMLQRLEKVSAWPHLNQTKTSNPDDSISCS